MQGSGEESSHSTEDEGELPYSWFPRCCTNYRCCTDYYTTKVAVVRSPFLQLPNLCLQVLIAWFIVCYSLAYRLSFMDTATVHSDGDVTALKPMSNWGTCSNNDFDCNLDLGDADDLPYCSNSTPFGIVYMHGIKHNRRVRGCWQNDVHIAPAHTILVPTMISFLDQSWNNTRRDWLNDKVEEYYMQDIESFALRFRHGFVSSSGCKKSSMDMDGLLISEGNQRYSFKKGSELTREHAKQGKSDPWSSIASLGECGTDPNEGNASTSCSRTKWGNVISVKKLLQFIGVTSLDSNREGMRGATYRQSGLGINIYIGYHNDDSVWTRFFFHGGNLWDLSYPPTFYSLDIQREPMARDFVVESKVTHPSINGTINQYRRLVEQQTGILVRISSGGSLMFASVRHLMFSAISAFALFALAQLLVEQVLVRIYRRFGWLQHISTLYSLHKHEGSKTEEAIRDDLEQLKEEDPDAYRHLVKDEIVTEYEHLVRRSSDDGMADSLFTSRAGGSSPKSLKK
jgi:hypothetical protein